MAKKKRAFQLHFVLDTNSLYTDYAHFLVSQSMATLIETSAQSDIEIQWYLPQMVIWERRHQMLRRAQELVPSVQKMERLLGHPLGINEERLEESVERAINKELGRLKINALTVTSAKVNWDQVIQSSAFRKPPFDKGEKEKGFRDAVILETFFQLAETLPTSGASCRVVLVTDDELMVAAFNTRASGRANLSTAADIDAVTSLINTLTSQVSEKVISEAAQKALVLFFEKGNEKSLYYKERIFERISEEFGSTLTETPTESAEARIVKRVIGKPKFISKDGQRIRWSQRITIRVEAIPTAPTGSFGALMIPQSQGSPPESGTELGIGLLSSAFDYSTSVVDQPRGLLAFSPSKRFGRHAFEVIWEVTLSTDGKLRNPKVVEINFLETHWASWDQDR